MLKQKTNTHIFIIVVIFSLFFSLFIISPTLLTFTNTPKGTINMIVGSYFADYYEYLSFIKQGQQGHLLLHNLFSHDDQGTYIIPWWPYAVFGFVSRIFSLPVQIVYWISSAVVFFALFLIIFTAVKMLLPKTTARIKLAAFLFTLLASPFFILSNYKEKLHIVPFQFWYSNGIALYRYGLPHHAVANIFLVAGLIAFSKVKKPKRWAKRIAILFILSLFLLISAPHYLLLLWSSVFLATVIIIILSLVKKRSHSKGTALIKAKKILIPFLVQVVLLLPIVIFFRETAKNSPLYEAGRQWDIANYYYPPFSFFVRSTGPIFILGILGLPFYFSKTSFTRLLFFSIGLLTFLVELIPFHIAGKNPLIYLGVHNLRFANPASYIVLGVSSVLFLKKISRKSWLFTTAVILFLLYSLIPIYTIWNKERNDPFSLGTFQFMPKALNQGLSILENLPENGVIFTPPGPGWGQIIPALSGQKVYLGRPLLTLNFDQKLNRSNDFYSMKMTKEQAKTFLKKESIKAVIAENATTKLHQFQSYYNLSDPIFQNFYLTIYPVGPPL